MIHFWSALPDCFMKSHMLFCMCGMRPSDVSAELTWWQMSLCTCLCTHSLHTKNEVDMAVCWVCHLILQFVAVMLQTLIVIGSIALIPKLQSVCMCSHAFRQGKSGICIVGNRWCQMSCANLQAWLNTFTSLLKHVIALISVHLNVWLTKVSSITSAQKAAGLWQCTKQKGSYHRSCIHATSMLINGLTERI